MAEKTKVIADTDFMNYMARAKGEADFYFNKLVEDLRMEPVVHEFLYNKEMMGNPLVAKLVRENKLIVMKYEDFLTDLNDSYYSMLFADLYKYCNGRDLKYGNSDFRTYQEAGANLGEIHSVILALYTGYPVFLSNDNGVKAMVQAKINTAKFRLTVKNVMDVFEEIAAREKTVFTKKDFVNLTKGDSGRKNKIQEIKNKWID
ncbi:MAG: hypothetical protein NC337_03700 [Roseburia sp.]|nr:hypothetical protein [Roseburia sp.]